MNRQVLTVLMLISTLGGTGCAFTPHQIELTAAPPAAVGLQIGEGVSLDLVVVDDRERQVVGQRGVGSVGSDISSPQLMTHLEQQITQGFQNRGFTIGAHGEPAHARLTVSLRSFIWHTQMGFWTGGENVHVAVRADAKDVSTKDEITAVYRYDNETRVLFIATGEEITKKMNKGLTNVLTQLFSDDELMRFLSATASK